MWRGKFRPSSYPGQLNYGRSELAAMRIGMLGSGLMGGKLGTLFARAGHDVVFSYARSEQKLKKLARDAKGKARAGTPRQAAQEADAILLAVHWSRVDDVLQQAGDVSGKVMVSCSLPMNADDTDLVIAHTSSGAEALAKKLPKARERAARSEEHTSELQSHLNLVCRLLLEKKKKNVVERYLDVA